MKILIVDDEEEGRKNLIQILSTFDLPTEIAGEADGVQSGTTMYYKTQPDLLLLDIQMRDGTGFDLLKQLGPINTPVVFVTAYDQFAVKAFRYHAIDYILKPIDQDELFQAVHKANIQTDLIHSSDRLHHLLKTIDGQGIDSLSLTTHEGIHHIALKRIIRLESSKNYTTFFIKERKKIVVAKTIGHYEEILSKDQFFRVHQSHIVRLDQILTVSKNQVQLLNKDQVPIARRRKEELVSKLRT